MIGMFATVITTDFRKITKISIPREYYFAIVLPLDTSNLKGRTDEVQGNQKCELKDSCYHYHRFLPIKIASKGMLTYS